ncbi:hypothetical protein [Methanothrix sp.]
MRKALKTEALELEREARAAIKAAKSQMSGKGPGRGKGGLMR